MQVMFASVVCAVSGRTHGSPQEGLGEEGAGSARPPQAPSGPSPFFLKQARHLEPHSALFGLAV